MCIDRLEFHSRMVFAINLFYFFAPCYPIIEIFYLKILVKYSTIFLFLMNLHENYFFLNYSDFLHYYLYFYFYLYFVLFYVFIFITCSFRHLAFKYLYVYFALGFFQSLFSFLRQVCRVYRNFVK